MCTEIGQAPFQRPTTRSLDLFRHSLCNMSSLLPLAFSVFDTVARMARVAIVALTAAAFTYDLWVRELKCEQWHHQLLPKLYPTALGYSKNVHRKAGNLLLRTHQLTTDHASHHCSTPSQRHASHRLRQDLHILVLALLVHLHRLLIRRLNHPTLLPLPLPLIDQNGSQSLSLLLLLHLADDQADQKRNRPPAMSSSVTASSIAVTSTAVTSTAGLQGARQQSRCRWLRVNHGGVGRRSIVRGSGGLNGGVLGGAATAVAWSGFVAG